MIEGCRRNWPVAVSSALLFLLSTTPGAAQEAASRGEVFRSGAMSSDIFGSSRPKQRPPAVKQAEQSPPQQPGQNPSSAALLGEQGLTPQMRSQLGGSNVDSVLDQTRTLKQAVDKSQREGGSKLTLEQALATARDAAGDLNTNNAPLPAAATTDSWAVPKTAPTPAPQAKPQTLPSGFARASLAAPGPQVIVRSTLSLIVDGADMRHAQDNIRRLSRLAQTRNVAIGNVYVVGVDSFNEMVQQTTLRQPRAGGGTAEQHALASARTIHQAFYKHLEDSGLGHYEVVPTTRVLDKWEITYSPTWIVRHRGRDYVFEGFNNPEQFFNREGEFVRVDR